MSESASQEELVPANTKSWPSCEEYGRSESYRAHGRWARHKAIYAQSYSGASSSKWKQKDPPPGESKKIPVLCTYFAKGRCNHGSACRFAHGFEEFDAIVATLARSRGAACKTRLCRFHENGRCRSGDQCFFAHGASDLQGAQPGATDDLMAERSDRSTHKQFRGGPRQQRNWVFKAMPSADPDDAAASEEGDGAQSQSDDSVDVGSALPTWFTDKLSIKRIDIDEDIDNCSTSSEVMKSDVKQGSSESSEEDDSSTVLSSCRESFQAPACDRDRDHGCTLTNPDQLTEEHEAEQEDEFDTSCVKVHQWDAEEGQWVVVVLDLADLAEDSPPACEQEDTLQEPPAISNIPRTRLSKVVPRTRLADIAKAPIFTPSRTPLRFNARAFVPLFGHGAAALQKKD